jgi:hypothetical protein
MNHLILIAERSPKLRSLLDHALDDRWPTSMQSLKGWRDAVAHPGKPFIDTAQKVPELWDACQFGERVLTALASGGAT